MCAERDIILPALSAQQGFNSFEFGDGVIWNGDGDEFSPTADDNYYEALFFGMAVHQADQAKKTSANEQVKRPCTFFLHTHAASLLSSSILHDLLQGRRFMILFEGDTRTFFLAPCNGLSYSRKMVRNVDPDKEHQAYGNVACCTEESMDLLGEEWNRHGLATFQDLTCLSSAASAARNPPPKVHFSPPP